VEDLNNFFTYSYRKSVGFIGIDKFTKLAASLFTHEGVFTEHINSVDDYKLIGSMLNSQFNSDPDGNFRYANIFIIGESPRDYTKVASIFSNKRVRNMASLKDYLGNFYATMYVHLHPFYQQLFRQS